jgi:hypothetical protein
MKGGELGWDTILRSGSEITMESRGAFEISVEV